MVSQRVIDFTMASGTGAMFSYAQAAKGAAPVTQSNSSITSPAASENGSKELSIEQGSAQKRSKQISSQNEDELRSTTPAQSDVNHGDFTHSREATIAETETQELQPTTKTSDTNGTTSSINTEVETTPSDLQVGQQERFIDSEQPITSPISDRSVQTGEVDKGKDIDDDWEKISVPSIAAEKELKAAPPPPVNVWLQRKEAQEAKAKEMVGSRTAPAGPAPKPKPRGTASVDEGRRQANSREQNSEKEINPAPRRVNSGNRTTQDRKDQTTSQMSPRSLSKQNDRSATSPPPPTADTSSWPTPDTTLTDERRRSVVPEKGEKIDAKANNQKKSWIQMPFVPTAKFETQLPPAASARRGGRPSNRGRDLAGRGGNASAGTHAGEKTEAGSMGPPPLPSKATDNERGRKSDLPRNIRASSVPTHGQRAPSKDSNGPLSHRASDATTTETALSSTTPTEIQSAIAVGFPETDAHIDRTSRSSSRKPVQLSTNGHRYNAESKATGQSPVHNGSSSLENHSRSLNQVNHHKGAVQDGSRPVTEHTDHNNHTQGREFARGRTDIGREKTESWRVSREGRSDRGRGGYRGRGNYTQHSSSHSYTPSLSQNGIESSKSMSSQETRFRQASQASGQPQPMGNSRNSSRSQSIPLAMMQQGFYSPMQGYPQTLSPNEMTFGNYPQQVQSSGIMSAMPYNEQLNSYALISMVITQL